MRRSFDRSSAYRVPSLVWCGLLLLAVRLHLKVCGFGRSIVAARHLGRSSGDAANISSNEASSIVEAVATAAAFFPGRAICLEQSLTLYILLRRCGVPVELRLGVQPYPFNAHAWVERNGEPVNEAAEDVAHFLPLPELAR